MESGCARRRSATTATCVLAQAAAGKYKKKKAARSRGKAPGDGGASGNGGAAAGADYYRCAEAERDIPYETIQRVARSISCGGVGVLPTDSSYAFVCDVSNVAALTKMCVRNGHATRVARGRAGRACPARPAAGRAAGVNSAAPGPGTDRLRPCIRDRAVPGAGTG